VRAAAQHTGEAVSTPRFPPMPQQLDGAMALPNVHINGANEPRLVYVREDTLKALREVANRANDLVDAANGEELYGPIVPELRRVEHALTNAGYRERVPPSSNPDGEKR
jgi:type VI protein secretion system component VasF